MAQMINEYGQPIGAAVEGWTARVFPGDMCYEGQYTIVTNLKEIHISALYKAYENGNPSSWTYLVDAMPENEAAFEELLRAKIDNPLTVCYVVIQKETNTPLGIFSLMRIDQQNGVIEVGNVNFSDALKRTTISTEAHQLLASYVFDELGYRRYEWKCDALNAPSIKTAKRLGFTYEGTFRNAVIYKGRERNTCWFSMLQEEWSVHKKAMTNWLASENFDEKGIQVRKLEEFR